jgi:hypothetical protein
MDRTSINPYQSQSGSYVVPQRKGISRIVAWLWILILLASVVAAPFCFLGLVANAWAADVPPGRANPNYDQLIFAANFFGIAFLGCLAAMVGSLAWRIMRWTPR